MLALTQAQMRGIEGARFDRLHRRTTAYLLRVGADRLQGRSESKLHGDTGIWLKSGMAHGIKTERALWQWSYLQLYTGGRLTEAPGLQGFLRDVSGDPDNKIETLMTATINRLRETG